jgi:GT2 family glycosyltransferase
MNNARDVSIVIPTWNGRELLAGFLPSVVAAGARYRDQHLAAVEIIIVDDSSTDGTHKWLAESYVDESLIRVVRLGRNSGFVRAANRGFAEARHPVVLLLNNDVKVSPDAIAPLVTHFEDDRVFAVCSKAFRLDTDFIDGAGKLGYFKRGFWRVYANYDVLPVPAAERPERLYSFFGSGAYTAYDAEKLSALGWFQDVLAPMYWEDVEVGYRAWKRGWTVEYEPASVVYHLSSATTSRRELQSEVGVVTERNRLLMTWINLHDPMWFVQHLIWLAIKLTASAMTFDWLYWRSFREALRRLGMVKRARRAERIATVRTDRQVAAVFASLGCNPSVHVFENVRDYPEYVRLKRELEESESPRSG